MSRDYFLGVWYLSWPGHDWVLTAAKDISGQVHATSKIRDIGPCGHVYLQQLGDWPPETDVAAIDRLRRMVADVSGQLLSRDSLGLSSPGVLLDEVIVCGDAAKCRRLLRVKPWVIDDSRDRWANAD